MARGLIVSHDVVGPRMAGPGIRYWEIAAALTRRGLEVALAAPRGSELDGAPFEAFVYGLGEGTLVERARRASCAMVTGPLLEQFPALKGLGVPLVVDLYDPFLFENLHRLRGTDASWPEHEGGIRTLAEQARCGDYFVCANERQRDLYLGMLAAWGRVNPTTYERDETLDSLLGIVPFGLPEAPPQPGRAARGAIDGIGADDRLIVWNGGLWDWFDPETAVRAVARLADYEPRARLLFLGTRHPNPLVGEPAAARRTRALAAELGLLDRQVFFREWTPYAERGAYLLEADVALSLHLPGVETRYASRTRLLDCIWAGLPVVTTEGDAIGDDLAVRGLALAVAPGDDEAAARALARLLAEPDARERRATAFAELARGLTWERAVAPLVEFMSCPRRAADRRPAEELASAAPVGAGDREKDEAPAPSVDMGRATGERAAANAGAGGLDPAPAAGASGRAGQGSATTAASATGGLLTRLLAGIQRGR